MLRPSRPTFTCKQHTTWSSGNTHYCTAFTVAVIRFITSEPELKCSGDCNQECLYYSQSTILPKHYIHKVLYSQSIIFPEHYITKALYSQSSILPKHYITKALYSESTILPKLYIPRALYYQSSILPEHFIPRALYY